MGVFLMQAGSLPSLHNQVDLTSIDRIVLVEHVSGFKTVKDSFFIRS